MQYEYKGINNKGIEINGSIESDSIEDAISEIKNKDKIITILKIKKKKKLLKNRNISEKDILFFTKRLQILLYSGIGLNETLEILKKTTNKNLSIIINKIIIEINKGNSLSNVLNLFPQYFNSLYISLIKIGETSGNLNECLKDIIFLYERKQKILNKIKIAIIYPKIIAFVFVIFLLFGCFYFIPTFETLFENQSVSLPLITVIVFFVFKNVPYILFFIFLIYIIAKKTFLYKYVKTYLNYLCFVFPYIKKLFINFNYCNFCFCLNIMLKNGLNLNDSLNIYINVTTNSYIKNILTKIINSINNGNSFSNSLKFEKFFDKIFYNVIFTAEESGELIDSLDLLTNYFNKEFDELINSFIEYIQPLMIILIAIIIIPTIFAIYLPILDISTGNLLNF